MPERKPIRYLLVPLVLVVLLVAATTLGNVWHHHAGSSDANCPICHLNHQPMERSLASDHTPALAPLGSRPDPQVPGFTPGPAARRVPARAPPTA